MAKQSSSSVYGIVFAVGLAAVTLAGVGAFWQVTGSEVRRSAADAEEARREPPPPPPPDTTTAWQPEPEVALLDTVFLLREAGRLVDALDVLERWLDEHPDDRLRRLDAARLAFEALRRERGVEHYRRFLFGGMDRAVLREAVERILAEFEATGARRALTRLLPVDDAGYRVRIGLAKAMSDAGNHAGADSLLMPIPPHTDPVVDALRLTVRRSLDPDIPSAMRWVQEYPGEVHYRLVLARALARHGRPGDALEHYVAAFDTDTTTALREEAADAAVTAGRLEIASGLLERVLERDPTNESALLSYARVRARLGDEAGAVRTFERLMALSPTEERFAEARGVLFEVDDVRLTLPLLARLIAFRPTDDALRLRYAQDLERTAQLAAAEAQYDTLLLRTPSAPLLMTRARLRAAQNNLPGALADAAAAEAREPTAEAAFLQAEIHRWREERDASRRAYDRAAALAPNDPRIAEGRRLLAVQRQGVLNAMPAYGLAAHSSALGDSDGFEAFLLRGQQGSAPFVGETVLLAGGELRRATGNAGVPLNGFGGDVGVAQTFGHVTWLARAGAVVFDGGGANPTALVEVTRPSQTLSLRAALVHQPAYESLRAGATLAASDVLMATSALASVSAQLTPRLDVYAQADHTALGDGNGRSVAAGAARLALGGPFAVLYTASAATFAEGTAEYWSPNLYVTQGVGVDVRRDRREGWSVGARIAPAYAWIRESAPGTPVGTQTALQGTLSADATWRRGTWEIGAHAGYGQDRAGTYSAAFGGLRARVTP